MLHVLIPARKGSKGVPDKNLRPLGGKSLIERAVEVGEALNPDRITISTDYDIDRLPEWIRQYHLRRPDCLCEDETPMAAVVRHWATTQVVWPTADVVLLQPTNLHPDRAGWIRKALAVKVRPIISVDIIPDRWHPLYALIPGEKVQQPYPTRRQGLPLAVRPNGLFYILDGSAAHDGQIVAGRPHYAVVKGVTNIDTPDDWAEAERQYGG